MLRTFRYPMHPTVAQEQVLNGWVEACRVLYNAALQERKEAWEKNRMRHALFIAFIAFIAVASFCSGAVFERHTPSDEFETLHWRVRVLELEVALLEERVKTVASEFSELRVRTKALLPNVDEL